MLVCALERAAAKGAWPPAKGAVVSLEAFGPCRPSVTPTWVTLQAQVPGGEEPFPSSRAGGWLALGPFRV